MDAKEIKVIADILVGKILKECASRKIKPSDIKYCLLTKRQRMAKNTQHTFFLCYPETGEALDTASLQNIFIAVVSGINKNLKENKYGTVAMDNVRAMKGDYFCAFPYVEDVK